MIIYFHRNPTTKDVFYVGLATSKKRAFDNMLRNIKWHKYVSIHGKPIVEIVHTGLTKEYACEKEIYYVKFYGREGIDEGGILMNLSKGGMDTEAMTAYAKKFPERNPMFKDENKKRLRENNPMHNPVFVDKLRLKNTGKKASNETKLKQRLAKLGKPGNKLGFKNTPETIEKMRIINKEIANRPEVKAKLRAAFLGKRIPKTQVSVNMLDINTCEVIKKFACITDALIYLGKSIRSGNISSVCRGRRSHTFGFKWAYD
jgi:hypothetical protein